jgi:hypothetical protein
VPWARKWRRSSWALPPLRAVSRSHRCPAAWPSLPSIVAQQLILHALLPILEGRSSELWSKSKSVGRTILLACAPHGAVPVDERLAGVGAASPRRRCPVVACLAAGGGWLLAACCWLACGAVCWLWPAGCGAAACGGCCWLLLSCFMSLAFACAAGPLMLGLAALRESAAAAGPPKIDFVDCVGIQRAGLLE